MNRPAISGAPDPAGREVRRIVHRIGDALVELAGEGGGRPIVAAVSGGADSTAMVLALADAAPRTGWRPRAVHVDHGIAEAEVRGAFRDSARRAAEIARVPFEVVEVDAMAELAAGGGGIEAAARRARYRALTERARAGGAPVIATAHTLRDQAETVLMRIIRGGPVAGLAGIPAAGDAPHDEQRGEGEAAVIVVRPLLEIERAEAELLCAAWGAEPAEDPANADPAILRARIRGEIMPRLRGLNPRVERGLADLAAQVGEQLEAAD